ncbi:MAG: class I SAM-dependent methyltransferase [Burkholderiaceae bacterium]
MNKQTLPAPLHEPADIRPGQSVDLLKALHILTRDGKLNQDSRRKLKQVYHLIQFIEPLLIEVRERQGSITLVDQGAGKSYLGFILYDLFFKNQTNADQVIGVETRAPLVEQAVALASRLQFTGMRFVQATVEQAWDATPDQVDIVTALHACDTATDDAIAYALRKRARHIVLVPCCQAEVATHLRQRKSTGPAAPPLAELWRRPLHTREFGSQVTNVLRGLQLEAHGYQVTVTELVGWEHSLKNELIVASKIQTHNAHATQRLQNLLAALNLSQLDSRFFVPGRP